jgi:L-2-hydroxyglutarate oxidase LhgO
MSTSIGIVGGGFLGAALLHLLTERHPDCSFTLFEKESAPALHQTGHNSGVVHAGLYYTPGSLKATLTRRGVALVKAFAEQHGLPYDECGKLLIATDEAQVHRLEQIAETARANGVPGIEILRTLEQIRRVEPHANGIAALHSPTTAITDYAAITRKLLDLSEQRGAELRFGARVTGVTGSDSGAVVEVGDERLAFDRVIVCAGLQSDRIAKTTGGGRFPAIVPFAGSYYTLAQPKADLVKGLIYPVPDPAFPFLGVHLSRMIDGRVLVGPSAFLSFRREGYSSLSFSLRDSLQIAGTGAFWRFAARNIRSAVQQLEGNTRRAFARQSRDFISGIERRDLLPGTRGVRAQAMRSDGALEEDFVIERSGRVTHVRNAPSPAATSSMAIAEHIADMIGLGAGGSGATGGTSAAEERRA